MVDTNVYQHYRKEEQGFIDQVDNWVEQASVEYRPVLTHFLDPRETFIIESILGDKGDLRYFSDGGYVNAERKRAFIAPSYFDPKQEDFDIQLFEIKYPTKFADLTHGKILGTLVNAGIKRDAFGDIMTDGDRWQFLVEKNMADYIQEQITKIGSVSVHLVEKDYTELITPKDAWTDEVTTTNSLRIDALISKVYNISRQRAKTLVDAKQVKLNWQVFEKPDFELDLLDILSVRGYGRIQLRTIEGKTKKDKFRVLLGVLRKDKS